MINQVSGNTYYYNTAVPNAFNNFNLTMNAYQTVSQTTVDNNEEKEKHRHKLGLTIATSAVVLGFGVLALMKGMPKGCTKKLENLKGILEKRLDKL